MSYVIVAKSPSRPFDSYLEAQQWAQEHFPRFQVRVAPDAPPPPTYADMLARTLRPFIAVSPARWVSNAALRALCDLDLSMPRVHPVTFGRTLGRVFPEALPHPRAHRASGQCVMGRLNLALTPAGRQALALVSEPLPADAHPDLVRARRPLLVPCDDAPAGGGA